MLDPAGTHVSTWRSRDFEAQMLVEILRLSRLTVLYGAEGAGKTTLLKANVLPLLRPPAPDDRPRQDEKPRVVVPFPDRRVGHSTADREVEVPVIFDRWDGEPLAVLLARILHTLRNESMRTTEPLPFLTDSLAAWNKALGVRFFIILDGFEQYLRAPFDRAGIAEFEEELVRAINAPRLAAHFLLSVRDDAEASLNRFRGRINDFGHAFLRLPSFHKIAQPSFPASRQSHRTAATAIPVALTEALTPPSIAQESDAHCAAVSTRAAALPPRPGQQPLANQTPLEQQASRSIALVPEAQRPASGEALPVAPSRSEPPRPVQRSVRVPFAAIIAGFAIGAGAGYFSTYGYQGLSAWQSASRPNDLVPATMHDAGTMPVPAVPATPADPSVPAPVSKRATSVHKSGPPPRSPAPIQSAKAGHAGPKARQAPVKAAPVAVTDWKTEMHRDLDVCRQESFFPRVVCLEKVRWKHCAPNHWNAIPECAATAAPATAPTFPAAAAAAMSPSLGMRPDEEPGGARGTDARRPRSPARARPPAAPG